MMALRRFIEGVILIKRIAAPVFCLSVGFLIAVQSPAIGLDAGCAAPMPQGFDWPADPDSLYRISGGLHTTTQNIDGTIDVAAQRHHGWELFAGVTQPSGSSNQLPVFHTWYTAEETFDPSDGKIACNQRSLLIPLSLPTQLVMTLDSAAKSALLQSGFSLSPRFDVDPTLLGSGSGTTVDPHDDVVAFSHVAFNGPMYDYIRDNQYYKKSVLDATIDPKVALRPIVDPPTTAISLKFSWWPVAADALSVMPVWDNDPRFPGDAKNPPDTWKRVVMVDPIGGLTAPANVTLAGFDHPNPQVVPLSKFYSVKVTAEEATLANADFRIQAATKDVLGRPLQEGDYLVMTALHIATREFDPWVFTTFWWTDQPGANNPLSADMPSEVQGVFRNYQMDVSFNINQPKQNGAAPIAYNPWLELFQKGGTMSQCMACHARAAYGQGVQAFFDPSDMSTADPNGFEASPQSSSDPNFASGTLSLHRIWTIQTRAK